MIEILPPNLGAQTSQTSFLPPFPQWDLFSLSHGWYFPSWELRDFGPHDCTTSQRLRCGEKLNSIMMKSHICLESLVGLNRLVTKSIPWPNCQLILQRTLSYWDTSLSTRKGEKSFLTKVWEMVVKTTALQGCTELPQTCGLGVAHCSGKGKNRGQEREVTKA